VAFPSPQDAKDWSAATAVQGTLMDFDLHLFRLTRSAGTANKWVPLRFWRGPKP
jgi:hypothetical protein